MGLQRMKIITVIKTTFLLKLVFLLMLNVNAQQVITGRLVNFENEPISFANILLLEKIDSSFIRGVVSDLNGHFMVEGVDTLGRNLLKITCVGYDDKYHNFEESITDYIIQMNTHVEIFDELLITGKKELFELQNDRLVVNVGSTSSFGGNDGLQVLQKLPGIVIDQSNSSISMVGKGEVMIMIDNKIQRMPTQVIISQLEGLRAERIERIELIHQPGAKYDASGAAGILNIITKKSTSNGSSGAISIMAGYGQKEKTGLGANINFRQGVLNLYGDYSFSWNSNDRFTVDHFREYSYLDTTYYYQNYFTWDNRKISRQSGNIGLKLDMTPGISVGASLSASTSMDRAISYSNSFSHKNYQLEDTFYFTLFPETDIVTFVSNLNVFSRIDEQNTLIFDINNAQINFENRNNVISHTAGFPLDLTTKRSTEINIWTGSIDYLNQINKKLTLESGLKGSLSEVNSHALVSEKFDSSYVGSSMFSGSNLMKEQILASFATINYKYSSSLSAELGIRYEYYQYTLNAARDEEDSRKLFSSPFPVLRINKKIDSLNSFQVVYNRSIRRAAFNTLGLYFSFLDPYTIAYSNPQLQPAFSNNLRLSFQHRSVIFSLGYLNQKNDIFWYNRVNKEKGIQISNPQNLDKSQVYEASLNFPLKITGWWESSWSIISLFRSVYDISRRELPYTNDQLTFSGQINNHFSLSGGWSIDFNADFISPHLIGDQMHQRKPNINAGIKKSFSKSLIVLSLIDIGNSSNDRIWEHNHPELNMRTFGHNAWSERQIRLTFTYNLGENGQANQKRSFRDKELESRI